MFAKLTIDLLVKLIWVPVLMVVKVGDRIVGREDAGQLRCWVVGLNMQG